MVHTESSEGKQYKPRGRPFVKGNKRGKLANSILADSRHDSSNKGGIVAVLNKTIETPSIEKEVKEEAGEIKTIETMEFKNGDNILSIRFSAVNNRRYRIQVFLNDETEVRPVTYQGSTSGYAFWKLLKGALKK